LGKTVNQSRDRANKGDVMTLAFLFLAYMFPAVLAMCMAHRNAGAIFVLNLFLGWTFIGWVISLVWACMKGKE
jgi:hypothetical protein